MNVNLSFRVNNTIKIKTDIKDFLNRHVNKAKPPIKNLFTEANKKNNKSFKNNLVIFNNSIYNRNTTGTDSHLVNNTFSNKNLNSFYSISRNTSQPKDKKLVMINKNDANMNLQVITNKSRNIFKNIVQNYSTDIKSLQKIKDSANIYRPEKLKLNLFSSSTSKSKKLGNNNIIKLEKKAVTSPSVIKKISQQSIYSKIQSCKSFLIR